MSADEIFHVIHEKPNSIIAPYLIEYISDLEKGESKYVDTKFKYCYVYKIERK